RLWAPPGEVRAEPHPEVRSLHTDRGPDLIVIRQTATKPLEIEGLVIVGLEVVEANRPAAGFHPLAPREIDWVEREDLATPHAGVAAEGSISAYINAVVISPDVGGAIEILERGLGISSARLQKYDARVSA